MTYQVDLLIPTARFVFSVEGEGVSVLPEHRSPEAFVELPRPARAAAGGGHDDVPQHGAAPRPAHDPRRSRAAAPERPGGAGARGAGLSPADVDLIVLTHAHLDHAGGCASVPAPIAVHERETASPYWPLGERPARTVPTGAPCRRRRRTRSRHRVGSHAGPLRRAHQPGRATRPRAASSCAATPSARRRPSLTRWRPPGRRRRPSSRRGAASAPGIRCASSPGTCHRSFHEAGDAAQRVAAGLCYTQAPCDHARETPACLSMNTGVTSAETRSRSCRR